MPVKYRYRFSKSNKGDVPSLHVEDHYCAPLSISHYDFVFDAIVPDLKAYGADMLDKILERLDINTRPVNVDYLVMKDSMSRVKRALQELEAAVEDYDDSTGSKSQFHFESAQATGEVFKSEFKNELLSK